MTVDDRTYFFFLQILVVCAFWQITAHAYDPIEICGGAAGFDVRNLTNKVWSFQANDSQSCLYPQTRNSSLPDGCTISMSFCSNIKLPANCPITSSVCEIFEDNSSLSLATSVQQPFHTSTSGVGFYTTFKPGDNFMDLSNQTCNLTTEITFVCNSSAYWDDTLQFVPVTPVIEFNKTSCKYKMTFIFAGACPFIVPANNPGGNLSAGSVLLLIFLVSTILYFVFGSLINKARGKHGSDIVPHQEFWTALPMYIMEGILFTFTCGRGSGTNTYESI